MKQALEAATPEEMADYTAKAKAGEPVLVKGFDAAYDPAIDSAVADTIHRADQIMYENKSAGKKNN